MTGNQYVSRKRELMHWLESARIWLSEGEVLPAKWCLREWGERYAEVPASTRRRWKCGR